MDTGNGQGNTTPPEFTSGFPVDFAFYKRPATSDEWITSARLIQGKYLQTQTNSAEVSNSAMSFDNNTGWDSDNLGSNYQSWMWKRHAGFDVVTYKGTGANNIHNHSLNSTPQMMWVKRRDSTGNWYVYNAGLNGGSGPQNYFLQLDTADAEQNQAIWNNAPTSSFFSVSSDSHANTNNADYIAMLFASVDGISKCGYYDGSSSALTISTGFSPRFCIIKRTTGSSSWFVLDTTLGWGSGSDTYLKLSATSAQASANLGEPTATGFTVNSGYNSVNNSGEKYIYYAHV